MITEFNESSDSSVNEVAVVQIDINRHQKLRAFFYIVFKLVSQVCNETDAQLIMPKYKKNTMNREREDSYRSEKIMCFSLRILVSN